MDTIWTRTSKIPASSALPHSIRAEVAVIGGGMAGILTAFFLKRAGKEVIVLEGNRVGSGQTAGTTAKITVSHNLIYEKLLREAGEEKARMYVSANKRALKMYSQLVQEEKIACDFRECSSYLYSLTDAEQIKREVEAAVRLGIAADFTTETELPFPVAGSICYQGQATFHPLLFLKALAEQLMIYEKTQVTGVEDGKIYTDHGNVLADTVVFASHYPIVNAPGDYFARMHQERSYVLALRHAQHLEHLYLGVDSGEDFSFRNFREFTLLGGAGHRTGENEDGGQYQKLEKRAREYWGNCETVCRWSAQDCMTLDGIPYIGRYTARNQKWYVETGFGKWGMTSSMAAARMVTEQICQKNSGNARVFSPQRVPVKALKAAAAEGGKSAKGLAAPGGIRCPHLGCKLRWNPEEETWDCPCHGSRFDADGSLIDNPAVQSAAVGVGD